MFVCGAALMFVASVPAAILYLQYPSSTAVKKSIELNRKQVLAMKPWDAVLFYRYFLAPGVESRNDERQEANRERLEIGLAAALTAAAVGAILTVVGVVGMGKKGSG